MTPDQKAELLKLAVAFEKERPRPQPPMTMYVANRLGFPRPPLEVRQYLFSSLRGDTHDLAASIRHFLNHGVPKP